MRKTVILSVIAFIIVLAISVANPVLNTVNNVSIFENSTFAFNITTSAPDNGSTIFSTNQSFSWLNLVKFNNTIATITLTPNFTTAGFYSLQVNSNDSNSTSNQVFTIQVNDTNRKPVIDVFNQNVVSGFPLVLNLASFSSDSDLDSLTYAIAYTDTSKVNCSISSNQLTILAPTSFSSGTSSCNVTANDGKGGVTEDTFLVTVEAQNPGLLIVQPSTPTLVLNTNGGSTNVNFVLVENGNMPLNSVNITMTDFALVGSANVSFAQTVNNIIIADNTNSSRTYSVSTSSNNYLDGTYYSTIVAYYANGRSTSQQLGLTVRKSTSSLSVPSTITLGGSGLARNQTTSTSFVITNNGDIALNTLNVTAISDSRFSMNVSLDNSNFAQSVYFNSMNAGESRTIYVRTYVPISQTSAVTDIGDISVTSNLRNVTISSVTLQTTSMLEIRNAHAVVDKKSDSFNNGDTINDVKPGSNVDFDIEVKNLYSSSDNIRIDDIDITVTIEGIDDGDDLEETSSSFDLNENKYNSETLSFNIPKAVDEGNYVVRIAVEGEDKNGGSHTVQWTSNLEISKKSHEVEITSASSDLDLFECAKSGNFNVLVTNIGSNDEDEVKVTVNSPELGINFVQNNLELLQGSDVDSEKRINIPFTVPSSLRVGFYKISTKVYYSDDILDDVRDVTVEVKECQPKSTTTIPVKEEPTVIVQPTQPTNTGSTINQGTTSNTGGQFKVVQPTQSTGSDFFESPEYFGMLVVLNIAVISGIVYLFVIFLF